MLEVTHLFNSPVKEMYSYWTDPLKLVSWMGGDDITVKKVGVDLKVDGKFEIEMESPHGELIAFGEYKKIESDKLVFSWGWRETMPSESLMTVKFSPKEEGTLMTIIHENLPSEDAIDHHREGWVSSLKKLENFLG